MTDLTSLRLGFAFSAGVATFFAPCAYPLLPGYLAFFLGDEGGRLRDAVAVAGLVSLGFVLVYGALAGAAVAVGTRALRGVVLLEGVVGLLLIGFGTGMAAGRVTPGTLHVRLPRRRRTRTGFLVFGVVYAAAAAGCTAPVFVGVAGLALGAGPVAAAATLGAYTAGMVLVMVAVTAAAALGRGRLLGRLASRTGLVARLAGVLLVGAGVVQWWLFVVRYDGLAVLGLA